MLVMTGTYMGSFHLWEDNYIQLIFDDSTPPYEDSLVERSQKLVMTTSVQHAYFSEVVFLPNPQLIFYSYVDDPVGMNGSIHLDPHDCGGHLEHSTPLFIELRSHQLGINMSTWTWDPSLWMYFQDYFSIAVSTCT